MLRHVRLHHCIARSPARHNGNMQSLGLYFVHYGFPCCITILLVLPLALPKFAMCKESLQNLDRSIIHPILSLTEMWNLPLLLISPGLVLMVLSILSLDFSLVPVN